MPQIGAAAAGLLGTPVPVLLADACALLDIIRAPARNSAPHLLAVQKVASALTATPPGCQVVTASITRKEFTDHREEERKRLAKHIDDLEQTAAQFHQACQAVTIPVSASGFVAAGLPAALLNLAQGLLDSSVTLDPDNPTLARAYQRVIDSRRPAQHGAIKDSVMLEEYLELTRQLRAGGFTLPIVFLSSNPDDFCEGGARALHPDLQAEFAPLNLGFCMVWPAAVQQLGL